MPTFDDKDSAMLAERLALWNKKPGPRVGDYVEMPDGTTRRFTHDWGKEIQTTCAPESYGISFYFGKGYMSFSGGLDSALPKKSMTDTGQTKPGSAWFFHHDSARAHNGVHFEVPCRVWRFAA